MLTRDDAATMPTTTILRINARVRRQPRRACLTPAATQRRTAAMDCVGPRLFTNPNSPNRISPVAAQAGRLYAGIVPTRSGWPNSIGLPWRFGLFQAITIHRPLASLSDVAFDDCDSEHFAPRPDGGSGCDKGGDCGQMLARSDNCPSTQSSFPLPADPDPNRYGRPPTST